MRVQGKVDHLMDQFGRERKDFDYAVDSPYILREEERLHMDEPLLTKSTVFLKKKIPRMSSFLHYLCNILDQDPRRRILIIHFQVILFSASFDDKDYLLHELPFLLYQQEHENRAPCQSTQHRHQE